MGHLSLDYHGFGSSLAERFWRREWTHVHSHRAPKRERSPSKLQALILYGLHCLLRYVHGTDYAPGMTRAHYLLHTADAPKRARHGTTRSQ
eukprot:7379231-Prymnesium_polylepis.1